MVTVRMAAGTRLRNRKLYGVLRNVFCRPAIWGSFA